MRSEPGCRERSQKFNVDDRVKSVLMRSLQHAPRKCSNFPNIRSSDARDNCRSPTNDLTHAASAIQLVSSVGGKLDPL